LCRLGTAEKPAASPGNPFLFQDNSGTGRAVAEQILFLKTGGFKALLRGASQGKGKIRILISIKMARNARKFQQG
jgi:hypothetical protein